MLLAFNWYGYRLLLDQLENRASTKLQSKLDQSQYDEEALVEIRVPLNMPYVSDWTSFERFEGETEIEGVHYKYVKRKVESGELVLLCIPNYEKNSLRATGHNYFHLVNDLKQPGEDNQGKENGIRKMASDYLADDVETLARLRQVQVITHATYKRMIQQSFLEILTQPPDS